MITPIITAVGPLVAGYLRPPTLVVCYLGFVDLVADARETDLVPDATGVEARVADRRSARPVNRGSVSDPDADRPCMVRA